MANSDQQLIDPASFRDPSGFIFTIGQKVYRQINQAAASDYDLLISSGLYKNLVNEQLLVAHKEARVPSPLPEKLYKIIQPELIPFISYPYEWSFSQLKAAALLTLELQRRALEHGLSLKDATAYNVQFVGYRPVFIDTLSFEKYRENQPWVAYRQFCQFFLAPLALMAKTDLRLNVLLRDYVDGVPLDLTVNLLPKSSRLSFGLATHLYLHAASQRRLADKGRQQATYKISRNSLMALLASLESAVKKLQLPQQKTVWQDYYEHTNYTASARRAKEKIIRQWLTALRPKTVHDLGANTGEFSRLALPMASYVVASDIDARAVEENFRQGLNEKNERLLPLLIDLVNPSPAIGWANAERKNFFERASADMVLALALIHHLAIGHNIPLLKIAESFSRLGRYVVIEFIAKKDSNVQRLLASREDVFADYSEQGFEEAMSHYFKIKDKQPISQSHRVLYLLERR